MRRLFIALLLLLPASLAAQGPSARGDANADSMVNATDVAFLASNVLGSGPAAVRSCLADVNADAAVNAKDIFRLIDVVFAEGAAPPPQPAEVCDSNDNNCDGVPDDGIDLSSDEDNCGSCGTACFPVHAFNPCTSGSCDPVCDFGWASCDGDLNNGCETLLDTGATCFGTNLGEVDGEGSYTPVTRTGRGEAFFLVKIKDTGSCLGHTNTRARISLSVPPQADYDLTLRCFDCNGAISKRLSNGPGVTETIVAGAYDDCGQDESFLYLIQIHFVSGQRTACGDWELKIEPGPDIRQFSCGEDD